MKQAEIVIIGAGIIGLSAAFQLARRKAGRIVVLEKGRSPGEGSTGASSAVCRFKYTRPEMVRLAVEGIAAYRNWSDYLGLADPAGRFNATGVLWLGSGASQAAEVERLAGFGVRAEVIDDRELHRRYPAINPCLLQPDFATAMPHDCHGGGEHLVELDGGYFDPVDALTDLVTACRQLGVEFRFDACVRRALIQSGRVAGVELADGEVIEAEAIVTSAGPWCNRLFAESGFACRWPLRPTRIQAVHFDRPVEVVGDIPVTVDPVAGIYFRCQNRGQQLIVSSVLEEDEREEVTDPDRFATYADDAFIHTKLFAAQHRLFGLDDIRKIRGYSGLYTINDWDVHPIIGESPVAGLFVANGFSGHGFKLAPAIGSMLAQAITQSRLPGDCSVEPAFLSYAREPIALSSKSVLA